MSDLIKNIYDIKKSKSYIDYNKYHVGNIFGITKVSRWELMHSNFIAWALNPSSSHSLEFYPLLQLIKALEFLIEKPDNIKSRLDLNIVRKFYNEDFAIKATVEREVEHIDILIKVETKDKVLPILIENKVDSKENGKKGDQTKIYFNWGEKEFADRAKFYEPIYIFLLPEYHNSIIQKEEKYIRMTYQELVDYIIEPSMIQCGDLNSSNNYKEYLQCLSYQSDNEKGDRTMAISSEERKIIDNFIKENKNLIASVLNSGALKDEVDESAMSSLISKIRDYSTYNFDGNSYTKARLVLAVVKKYVNENSPSTYIDLQKIFPDKLQGSKGVVRLASKVSDRDKGIGGQKRYFVDSNDQISLSGEIDKILVCTEWGSDSKTKDGKIIKGNIEPFIRYAKNLGYTITKE